MSKLRKHLHQFDNTCAAFRKCAANTETRCKYRNALQIQKHTANREMLQIQKHAANTENNNRSVSRGHWKCWTRLEHTCCANRLSPTKYVIYCEFVNLLCQICLGGNVIAARCMFIVNIFFSPWSFLQSRKCDILILRLWWMVGCTNHSTLPSETRVCVLCPMCC